MATKRVLNKGHSLKKAKRNAKKVKRKLKAKPHGTTPKSKLTKRQRAKIDFGERKRGPVTLPDGEPIHTDGDSAPPHEADVFECEDDGLDDDDAGNASEDHYSNDDDDDDDDEDLI